LATVKRYPPAVNTLRPELRAIVTNLVARSQTSREVSLDALGDAIGSQAVSYAEIDAMITELERQNLRVTATSDSRGEAHLASLLSATRMLTAELGRRPSVAEIRVRSGLSAEQLKHALMLARVMQR
jgi:hypothetical protein